MSSFEKTDVTTSNGDQDNSAVLRGRVSDSLNEAVYNRFLADKIEIPFPQRDVYIRSMPDSKGASN